MKLRNFEQLDEFEVGRPRAKANPFTSTVTAAGNPLTGLMAQVEVLAQDTYDYQEVEVATVTKALTLFAISQGQSFTPLGGTAFVKNEVHTNLTGSGGQFPNPSSFMTHGLQCIVRPDIALADFHALMYQTQVDFQRGTQKFTYFQGLLGRIPAASGAFGFGTPAANGTSITQGWPNVANAIGLSAAPGDPGVAIDQGQQFAVVLDPTQVQAGAFTTAAAAAGGTGVHLWFYLAGVLFRGVAA